MRILLIALLILFNVNCFALVPKDPHIAKQKYAWVIKVFRDIRRVSGIPKLHLMITNGGSPYVDETLVIHLPEGELNHFFKHNISGLAAIIGHEAEHVINRDVFGAQVSDEEQVKKEIRADIGGKELAIRAGYDGCGISKFWREYFKEYGHTPEDTTHPDPLQRANYLECR